MVFFDQQVGRGSLRWRQLALVAIVSVAAIACEGAPARSKPWRNTGGEPAPGPSDAIAQRVEAEKSAADSRNRHPELRIGVASLPATKLTAAAEVGLLFPAVFEPLVPRLATIGIPDVPSVITIDLREGITTHSGVLLTASDVRRSLEVARRGSFESDLKDVAAVEVASPRRLRIRLRRPNGYVARSLEVIPIASANGLDGTGPFRVDRERSNDAIISLVNATSVEPRRAASLVLESSVATALARVQTGEYDAALDRRAKHSELSGVSTVVASTPRFRYLAFNARRSLFEDAEVRRAASSVIDREAIARDGYRRRGIARQWPIWPGGPVDAPAGPVALPDRAAASELLDRAGWSRSGDGTRERDKRKLIAIAVTSNATDPAVTLAFDQLRAAGFVLDVRELPADKLHEALKRGAYDLAVLEWIGYRDWDLSPLLSARGAFNFGRVESSALDGALALMRSAPSPKARQAAAHEFAAVLEEVVPIVCLVELVERYVLSENVRGQDQLGDVFDLRVLSRHLGAK